MKIELIPVIEIVCYHDEVSPPLVAPYRNGHRFKWRINKAKFEGSPEILNSALQKYATLLYPNTEIIDGGIHVHYSFRFPQQTPVLK